MTRIEITIQDRQGRPCVTWMEQRGEQLPQSMWDEMNEAINTIVEQHS